MFIRIETHGGCFAVVDEDFTQECKATWRGIANVYADRKLDVGRNLFRAMRYKIACLGHGTLQEAFSTVMRDEELHKYRDEIDKYMVLL